MRVCVCVCVCVLGKLVRIQIPGTRPRFPELELPGKSRSLYLYQPLRLDYSHDFGCSVITLHEVTNQKDLSAASSHPE